MEILGPSHEWILCKRMSRLGHGSGCRGWCCRVRLLRARKHLARVAALPEWRSSEEQGKRCRWCHRIFPIQETCVLSETELRATVSKLFCDFLRSKKDQDEPIKFAVAYNRRGIDETEMKPPKNSNEGSNQQALMDRNQCFKVVAAAVKSIAEKSVVDLSSPEVAVLIEMLPLSGVPLGSSVAGVSVLPAELISTKPRLCVRSLVSDAKTTKKK